MSRKDYMKKYNNEYTKTIPGLCKKIYHHQIRNCKQRNHDLPAYTCSELESLLKQEPAYLIYLDWIKSNYNPELIPSVDRLNNSKSYTLDNIEIVTWKVNKERARAAIRKQELYASTLLNGGHRKVSCFDKDGSLVNDFISLAEASRATGYTHQQISRACSTKYTYLEKYFWCYTDDKEEKASLFNNEEAEKQIRASCLSSGMPIVIYDLVAQQDTVVSSKTKAAEFLCSSKKTITKYIQSGLIYKNQYKLSYKDSI